MVEVVIEMVVMIYSVCIILYEYYFILDWKIVVIQYGMYLVLYGNCEELLQKYELIGWKVLFIFGFMSSGKNIELIFKVLLVVVYVYFEIVFLVIGVIYLNVVVVEGEVYCWLLEKLVDELQLKEYVWFIDCYVGLNELLEFLELMDIYFFIFCDFNQVVSGILFYVFLVGCLIILMFIVYFCELVQENIGFIVDFFDEKVMLDVIF